ncbi:MAG TPA: nitroreductase family deazaflavin-dependent oxidoreductase [Acidimicrobiia bacterium]|nr:nitroreductase family deazaflavin-dependent oxidoreductase [Acidimicrobiia bacterium]
MSNPNQPTIDEFRANEGRVGGPFEGKPLLLLHHVGAKSGTERVSPLMYQALNGDYVVFASKGGSDTNPAWYHNLRANPETEVEVGTETVSVVARVATAQERAEIWPKWKERYPQFAGYERKTKRQIPVLILESR